MPAVLCSRCATDLPEGAEFCLKCGQAVKFNGSHAALPPVTAILGCSKCGTNLPEGAQFCPKCGKPVSVPRTGAQPANPPAGGSSPPVDAAPIEPLPAKPHRAALGAILFLALGLLLVATAWVSTSDNPYAQSVQDFIGWKHDQTIVDGPFPVSPRTFRYYKFALPEGSLHVSIVGQFSASAERRNKVPKNADLDNTIEVYVLSEPAFTIWQNGYSAGSVYESGRVAKNDIEAELPAGAGIYFVVFNNRYSPTTAKQVTASVSLRYKNWVPESLRRAKERFWNWLEL
jgi:ribosomal protein L40E